MRVLYFCPENAVGSQMAEAFTLTRGRREIEVISAGAERGTLHPMAIRVMAEIGIDISKARTKSLEDLEASNFDVVITLCKEAVGLLPVLPGFPVRVDWNLANPLTVKGGKPAELKAFRQMRDEIHRLVDDFFEKGYLAALDFAKRCEGMILDNISDGILAHDMDRRIFHFNRAAELITGFRREDVINRDCHDVFPGKLCGGKCLFCEAPDAKTTITANRRIETATRDGEPRTLDTHVRTMKDSDGSSVAVLVTFRDITRERSLARRVGEINQFSGIIGRDSKMLEIYDLIRDLADTDVPVLVQGESGTGKELVAAAIHNEGRRAGKQFVPVNCGALPESLLESELFGHVKGAFTGAIRDKKGRFELADGGTIFLDEIGDITPTMQVKLMRVLQEGTFERVGSEQTIKVNVRTISATNKDIQEEIADKRFREDLFYRLSVVPVWLPPLRERRNDIPLIAREVLRRALDTNGRSDITISPEAMDVLLAHDWPGNVRELQNWIQFALVKCKGGEILPEHLPPRTETRGQPDRKRRRRKLDVDAVREALRATGGNKLEAARYLGVSRATLYRFLGEIDL